MTTISEIEKTEPVQLIRAGELAVWPVIRMPIFFKLRKGFRKHGALFLLLRTFTHMMFALPKFINMFKACDVLFCSDSSEVKIMNGQYYNRTFYYFYKQMHSHRLSYMETPFSSTYTLLKAADPMSFSSAPLHFLCLLVGFFVSKPVIDSESVLESIYAKLGVRVPHQKLVKKFIANKIVLKLFLGKIKKPKLIVMTDSYSMLHLALIAAAKELQIRTIEIQHGSINENHAGYNDFSSEKITQPFSPDYLFCYNEGTKNSLAAKGRLPQERIVVIGHPYLSYVVQSAKMVQPKQTRVLVTLQSINEKEVMQMIVAAADLCKDVEFRIVPRTLENLGRFSGLPQNIVLEDKLDFYTAVQSASVHLTGSSTCAVEAPLFGVPNILYDFDGIATQYYGQVIGPENGTVFIKSAGEIPAALRYCLSFDRNQILEHSKKLMSLGFETNLARFISDQNFI